MFASPFSRRPRRRQARSATNERRARRHLSRRLVAERLEDRRLLAVLFSHDADDPVRAIAPSESEYDDFGLDWTGGAEPFDDSAWAATSGAPNGVGFDRRGVYSPLLGLDLEASMHGVSPTLFVRASFDVPDPATVDRLTLGLRYDDGYIAWLNGVEIARANAASTYPAHSDTAAAEHQASTTDFDVVDLAGAIMHLRPGANMLAIRGLNDDASGDDALIQFTLVGESRSGPPLAIDDTATTDENAPVVIDVLANDQEGSGPINPASVAIATPPAHGAAVANPDGTITYTPNPAYNGQDTFTYTVRDGIGTGQPTLQTLVAANAPARAFVPTSNSINTIWRGGDEPFDDSAWQSGAFGVGYEQSAGYESFLGLNVGPTMAGINTSVYIRSTFSLGSPADVTALTLRMRYDDGFAAFINGVQVASANAPNELPYNASATSDHPDFEAIVFQSFDITSFASALRSGTNVLAIHGLNSSTGSSDMLIQPELTATIQPSGQLSNEATVTVTVEGVDFAPIARDDAYEVDEGATLEVSATSGGGGPTTQSLISSGAVWRYRDNGQLPPDDGLGNDWKQLGYDDASWSSGPAQLGYGDGDEATVIARDSNGGGLNITAWFRHRFTVDPLVTARAQSLLIDLLRDDGAAVYLNGVEVVRDNLPGVLGDSAVGPSTLASVALAGAEETTFYPFTIDLTSPRLGGVLRPGINDLAVEVHQATLTSSDLSFDLRASVEVVIPAGVLGNDTEPDGQTMTAVLETPPESGTLDFAPDGTFTYTPNAGFIGIDAFTYRASDGLLLSDPATVTITVNHVAPTAGDDTYTTDEDAPLVVDAAMGVLANDTDTQGHALTAELIESTRRGVLTFAADGSFSYVPAENYHGIDEFTYRASDGSVRSAVATVTITVRSVDDPTVAADDFYEVASGGTLVVDFALSLGGPIAGGSQATPLQPGGQLIYDRHRELLYRIGGGTIERFDVANRTLLAPYSVPTTITEGDITPDGRALYFADTTTGPGVGYIRKVSLDDGTLTTLTYSRGGSEAGGHDLTIGAGGIARFSTSYAGSGDTPIRRLNTFTDTFSPGGNAYMRSSLHSGPDQSLLVVLNTGISSFPMATIDGITDSTIASLSTFQVLNGGVAAVNRNGQLVALNCCNAGLNVRDRNLNLVRDLPDISNTVAFDAARDIFYAVAPGTHQLIAYDTNSWVELYRVPTGATSGSYGKMLTSANGQFAFVLTSSGVQMIDILNAPQVIVQAGSQWKYLDDGSDQGTAWREPGFNDYFWTTGRAQFGYGDGDEATVVSYGANPTAKHATTYFRRTFHVDDPSALSSLTLSLLADDGAAVYINGIAVARRNLLPTADYATFAFASVDGAEESQFFDFVVNPALLRQGENALAVEVHIRSAADDDMSFDLRLTANAPRPAGVLSNDFDGDGEPISAQLVSGPQFGVLDLRPDGTFTYLSNAGFVGTDTFTYRAVTASGQSDPATVTIDVSSNSGRPSVVDSGFSAVEDEQLVVAAPGLLAGATDPNGDPLTATLTGPPLHGSVSIAADGSFVYTPVADFHGEDAFIFAASDGVQLSNAGVVTITVLPINDVPIARDDEFFIDRGASLVLSAPSAVAETIAATSFAVPPTGAVSFTAAGGELGFSADTTPSATELGVLATDEYIVRGVSSPFVLSFDSVDIFGHRGVTARLDLRTFEDSAGSDFEPEDFFRAQLGLARVGGPVVLQTIVSLSGDQLKTLDNGPTGAYATFTADIPDGFLTATLTIETSVDLSTERVFFDNIAFTGFAATGGNLLLANDSDADGDALSVRIVAPPMHGAIVTDADGAMTYTPDPLYVGDDTFTYVAHDGQADSNEATVTIHVLLANLVPTAGDDVYTTNEDEPLVVSASVGLLANDFDLDGDPLTARIIDGPEHGTLVSMSDGSFTFTPAENYFGADSFTYVANDGRDDSNVATVTIPVLAVNDPPVGVDDAYTVPQGGVLDVTSEATGVNYADVILNSNPLAYWRFGEQAGPTAIEMVSGQNGAYIGGAILGAPGALPYDSDSAVALDGVSGYISVPPSSPINQLTSSLTVEAWIRPSHLNGVGQILSNRAVSPSVGIGLWRDGGRVGFTRWGVGGQETDNDVLIAGRWTHVVVTFDNDGWTTFYIDGTEHTRHRDSGSAKVSTQPLVFGRHADDSANPQFWAGDLDEVAIYSRVLSAAEAKSHYLAGVGISEVPLLQRGMSWRYRDNIPNGAPYPTDAQGDLWNEADYDDSAWPSGPAILGYDVINAGPVLTTIGFGGNPNDKYRTALFRRTFDMADPDRVVTLAFDALIDDGAAVYINGREVLRHNLPGAVGDGSLRTDTLAPNVGNEDSYLAFVVDLAAFPGLLVEGTNTIAVEVHQTTANSSDLGFDLSMTATVLPDPQAAGVLGNDFDVEDDPLTAELVAGPRHGSLELAPDGTFVYTPAAGFYGDDAFTYRAFDGRAYSNVATVAIAVARRLVAVADAYMIAEDELLAVPRAAGVLANDPDSLDPDVTAVLDTAAANGTVTLAANGAFHYRPNADFFGIDTFTYRTTDGAATSDPATVTITVAAVNDAPLSQRDVYTVAPGQSLTTRSASRSYSQLVGAAGPTAYFRLGEVGGTTARNAVGGPNGQYFNGVRLGGEGAIVGDLDAAAEFDGNNDYVEVPYSLVQNPSASFTVEAWAFPTRLSGVWQAVIASSDLLQSRGYSIYVGMEDRWLISTGAGNRLEGDLNWVVGPAVRTSRWQHVVVTFASDSVGADGVHEGTLRFYVDGHLVAVDDEGFYLPNASRPMRIGAAATESTSASYFFDGQIDEAAVYDRALSDEEIREHFRVGAAVLADSVADFSGTQSHLGWSYGYYDLAADDDMAYEPSDFSAFPDGEGDWSSTNYWDAVSGRWNWFSGDPPWTEIAARTMRPSGPNAGPEHWVVRRWISNYDGPAVLHYHVAKQDISGGDGVRASIYIDGVSVSESVINAFDATGVHRQIRVTLSVGARVDFVVAALSSDVADDTVFTSTVRADIEPPQPVVLLPGNSNWNFRDNITNGAPYPVDAQSKLWNEPDYDARTWALGGAILGYGGINAGPIRTTLQYGPSASNKYRTALFRQILYVADADRVTGLTFLALIDDGAAIYINGREVLRHNMPGVVGDGTLRTDTLALAPGNEDEYETFVVDLTDFPGLLVDGTNVIAVEVHQTAPDSSDLGFDLAVSAIVGSESSFPGVLGNDRDAEDDPMTAVLVAGPYHGALDFRSDGTFTYTPNPGFEGVDRFTYRATDGAADSPPALVTINVGSANEAPLAADDRYFARNTAPLAVSTAAGVLANDFDPNGDALAATVFSPPARGTLVLAADGGLVYTPQPGFIGVDEFTYRVADGSGAFGFATATIHVAPQFDPINGVPLAADDAYSMPPGTLLSVAAPGVLAGDHDPELRPLAAVVESQPWHGALSFAADGSFTYTPRAGFAGSDAFTYRATDGNTFSAPATVTITVFAPPPGAAGVLRGPDGPPLSVSTVPTIPTAPPTTTAPPSSSGGALSTGAGTTTTLPHFADLTADGRVDRADLAQLLSNYGKVAAATAGEGDLDGDGRIGLGDAINLRNAMAAFSSSSSAVVARASDAAIVQTSRDAHPLYATRRTRPATDGQGRTTAAAIDEVLAAGLERAAPLSARARIRSFFTTGGGESLRRQRR